MKTRPEFCYHGIFYETEEELIKAENQYSKSPITAATLRDMLHSIYTDLKITLIQIRRSTVSNSEMAEIMDRARCLILRESMEIEKSITDQNDSQNDGS